MKFERSDFRKPLAVAVTVLGLTTMSACGVNKSQDSAPKHKASIETPTTEAPTTTTTSIPVSEVAASNLISQGISRLNRVPGVQGEIAGFVIPALCNETGAIVSISEAQIPNVGDGPTATNVDQIVPDSPAQSDCATTLNHAASEQASGHTTYMTRGQRTNENYANTANQFIPVVGEWPGSPNPGNPGNLTLFGHRTTESAPFSSIDQLQPGNNIFVFDTNGTYYDYEVTGEQIIPATDVSDIVKYGYNSNNQATGNYLTLFACGPDQRDNSARVVIRAEETKTIVDSTDLNG